MTLQGKTIVITGASAGVGRATARAAAAQGASIALLARGTEALEATRKEVESAGGQALPIQTDVADHDAVESAAETVERELGPIDVWVNNAMVSVFAPFRDVSAEDFRRVTEVTYLGYVYGTQAALKRMLPRDRGKIIQVGSALAYRGIPLQSAYCGAKHAIQGFNESLRTELLHDKSNVKLTMIQLPAINTPQFHWVKTTLKKHPQPVPPIWQPEVAAEAILWATEHDRREINLCWTSSATVWANKFIPGLLDHYLARTGFKGQQADFPIEPNRADNLWAPVQGDFGAHGEFDSLSRGYSPHWWMNKNRGWVAAGAAAIGGALALLANKR